MRAFLKDHGGGEYELPPLTEYSFTHAADGAADSFEVKFFYTEGVEKMLEAAVSFGAEEGGECVFCGIVDEYETALDGESATVTVAGRGMGALLMDNEAESAEYQRCTLADILHAYAEPLGISAVRADEMGGAVGYEVENGASCWKAISDFALWVGGVTPRFTREGVLVLSKTPERELHIGERDGVGAIKYRERRYGVVSEVLIKGSTDGECATVVNEEFVKRGGRCRRVVYVPNDTGYDARRYTGEYVIAKSEKGARELTLTLMRPFAAFAGEEIYVNLPAAGISGRFFVTESVSWAGEGCGTRIKMTPEK